MRNVPKHIVLFVLSLSIDISVDKACKIEIVYTIDKYPLHDPGVDSCNIQITYAGLAYDMYTFPLTLHLCVGYPAS